jgi:hypothetical protein
MPSDNAPLKPSEPPFFEGLAQQSPEEQDKFWADVRGMIQADRERAPKRPPETPDEEILSRLD